MSYINNLVEEIENSCKKLPTDKNARKFYSMLPKEDGELISLLDTLVKINNRSIFCLITIWIKRRSLYNIEYFKHYEDWLYNYVTTWGMCDIFCYRVLNPMIENNPKLFDNVVKWTESKKTYVRRAAPVSLIISSQSFKVNYDINKVLFIAEKLKHDKEDHVKKGVGWLLKYTYLTYPKEVYNYLKNNIDNLPRIIVRYALEKTPKNIKDEIMSL